MDGIKNGSGEQEHPASAVLLCKVRLGIICFFKSVNIEGEVVQGQDGVFELTKEQLDHVVQENEGKSIYVGKVE